MHRIELNLQVYVKVQRHEERYVNKTEYLIRRGEEEERWGDRERERASVKEGLFKQLDKEAVVKEGGG